MERRLAAILATDVIGYTPAPRSDQAPSSAPSMARAARFN